MDKRLKNLSKFLSYVLRHNPDVIGIKMDENGWVDVGELIEKVQKDEAGFNRIILDEIVSTNDKKRFAFSEDGNRIRASQGHSIEVDLAIEERVPPDVLYHGTATRFLESIMTTGLNSGSRQHVHLTAHVETAVSVGQRHGKAVVLLVKAKQMHEDGLLFYLSENNVWLTEHVPVKYIEQEGGA